MPNPVEFENLLSYQNRMKEAAAEQKSFGLAGHFTAAITLCSEIRTDLV